MHDFLFDGSCNACPICHHFQNIRFLNVHDHDLDLWKGSTLNANILIERPYITISDGNCNVCHVGHHFQAICCQTVHDLDHDLP